MKLRHAFNLASAIAKSSQHSQSQLGPRKMTPHPVDALLGTMWMEASKDGRDGGPVSAANLCSKLVETSDSAQLSFAASREGWPHGEDAAPAMTNVTWASSVPLELFQSIFYFFKWLGLYADNASQHLLSISYVPGTVLNLP